MTRFSTKLLLFILALPNLSLAASKVILGNFGKKPVKLDCSKPFKQYGQVAQLETPNFKYLEARNRSQQEQKLLPDVYKAVREIQHQNEVSYDVMEGSLDGKKKQILILLERPNISKDARDDLANALKFVETKVHLPYEGIVSRRNDRSNDVSVSQKMLNRLQRFFDLDLPHTHRAPFIEKAQALQNKFQDWLGLSNAMEHPTTFTTLLEHDFLIYNRDQTKTPFLASVWEMLESLNLEQRQNYNRILESLILRTRAVPFEAIQNTSDIESTIVRLTRLYPTDSHDREQENRWTDPFIYEQFQHTESKWHNFVEWTKEHRGPLFFGPLVYILASSMTTAIFPEAVIALEDWIGKPPVRLIQFFLPLGILISAQLAKLSDHIHRGRISDSPWKTMADQSLSHLESGPDNSSLIIVLPKKHRSAIRMELIRQGFVRIEGLR